MESRKAKSRLVSGVYSSFLDAIPDSESFLDFECFTVYKRNGRRMPRDCRERDRPHGRLWWRHGLVQREGQQKVACQDSHARATQCLQRPRSSNLVVSGTGHRLQRGLSRPVCVVAGTCRHVPLRSPQ